VVNVRSAIIVGVALGVTAALVVWWLERFEVARLHAGVETYLDQVDRFRKWQAEHGQPDTSP
jgi:hypothetical protein